MKNVSGNELVSRFKQKREIRNIRIKSLGKTKEAQEISRCIKSVLTMKLVTTEANLKYLPRLCVLLWCYAKEQEKGSFARLDVIAEAGSSWGTTFDKLRSEGYLEKMQQHYKPFRLTPAGHEVVKTYFNRLRAA